MRLVLDARITVVNVVQRLAVHHHMALSRFSLLKRDVLLLTEVWTSPV